jgi:prolyl-tRNA synthetase
MMGNGWALQSGTSHYLGTNFARAFNTRFLDENNEQRYVHQTSWGVSTRLVGAVIMVHGDDAGLRLPPALAPVQVVVVPIHRTDEEREAVMKAAGQIRAELEAAGVRVKLDDRSTVSPGFKFHHWEVRGVPLRLELGPRDLQSGVVTASARNRPGRDAKFTIGLDSLREGIVSRLAAMQGEMLDEARARMDAMTWEAATYEEFKARFEAEPGFCRVWWDGSALEEDLLQQETKATVRCIPLDQDGGEGACFMTGRTTSRRAIVARAY